MSYLKSVSSHLKSIHQDDTKRKNLKKTFVHNIRMMNLSLNELKLIASSRRIKAYKNMSKERSLSALNESESIKGEKNFDDARTKKYKKRF